MTRRVLFMATAMLLNASCSGGNGGEGGFFKNLFKGASRAVPVTVANVYVEERPVLQRFPGKLVAGERTEIRLPFEVVADQVMVNVGDTVLAGASLFHLSEESIQGKLAERRTELTEAQTDLERKQYDLRNRDTLLSSGRITQSDYDSLEEEVEALEKTVQKLETEIQSFESQLDRMTMTAPIAGLIETRNITPGLMYAPDTVLVTIVKVDPMFVEFQLPTNEAASVRTGHQVKVRVIDLGGETLTATVSSVGTAVDAASGALTAHASFPNPTTASKVGMLAEVELAGSNRERLFLVPTDAIFEDGGFQYVFTVVKGIAHRVRVVPRGTRGETTEIVAGLREDDLVVVKGHADLNEGTTVDIWRR
ncbi:MAG: efflux RND transporter periplasmic adaptor subunit [Deltaproteobacteria bacterium]|nr:efflux RND transporter periplasmic adaptor subunit [Deltaproteobacteria bacterium]